VRHSGTGGGLRLSLLGERVITGRSGALRTRSSRTIELLAFLVVHAGSPQPRQRMAALFWPDSGDEQALTNLRRELHHLRGALGETSSLVVTGKDLCWQDTEACVVDVRVFARERDAARTAAAAGDDQAVLQHAQAAVDAYGGDLLPGSYDDWVLDARSDLEHRCVEVIDLLCATRCEIGDLAGAVDTARRRITVRPLEEIGYRRLMQLQGELGDRAGAVSTYHHCASVLERELGVEPDPATRAVLDRLLARVSTSTTPVPPAVRSGQAATTLVGRVKELGVLHDAWDAASAGRPGLVLVRGDAGVGKSRLVAELAETARLTGAVVASAQCFGAVGTGAAGAAGQLALAPVADWLRTAAVRAGTATLDPLWQAEVERLVPTGKGRGEPSARDEAWLRHRFLEGLARALLSAGRPTLLVLDNLQWCDQETLAFLTFLRGLAADAPLLVVATVRIDDIDDDPHLRRWVAQASSAGLVTTLDLGPLDDADTAELARSVTGTSLTAADARVLQATTGGYPLYIVESARGGGSFPTGDVGAVLTRRLAQVSETARDVAGLASAVGRTFSLDLLSEAGDLDADSVVAAVDELWRHRIVRETGDGYDFSHDLLRDAAYAQVSPPRRWLLHRRVAQGLELLHADDPDSVSAQLAEQYHRGGRADRAVEYYRRAADVAAATFAHGEAVRLHRAALALVQELPPGRDRMHRELVILEAMAAPLNAWCGYASAELRAVLDATIELATTVGRRDTMLAALVSLWSALFVQGDLAVADRTGRRALALLEPGSALAGPAHFAAGGTALSRGHIAEALEHFALSEELGGRNVLSVGTRPDVHGRAFVAHAHWLVGHDDEAVRACEEAILLARTSENPYSLAVALAYAGITHQMRRADVELADVAGELCDLCERYDFAYYREWALVLTGWQRGDIELARRGVDNLKADGAFARMPYWLSLVADLEARLGRPDAAVATLDAAIVGGQARSDHWWLPEVLRMRASFDRRETAIARLDAAARLAGEQGSVVLERRCRADLAALACAANAAGTPRS
jgi:DNA-binding SARP family transcriptional activator/tetratricopeptide (TPR) repeat protein